MPVVVFAGSVLLLAFAACDGGDPDAAANGSLAVEVCEQDEQCGPNRLCVCGRCTLPCASDEGCMQDSGPALACYRMQSSLLADRCTGVRPELYPGVCLQTCDAERACDDDQQCRNGACVPQLNREGQPATSGRAPDDVRGASDAGTPAEGATSDGGAGRNG